jgi:hypothetical protein
MNIFRHHPDGKIIFSDSALPMDAFSVSLENFKKKRPTYNLPNKASPASASEKIIGREYVQGEYHRLFSKDSQFAGEFPWLEGDAILANANFYKDAPIIPEDVPYQPSIAEMVHALWMNEVDHDKSGIDAILAKLPPKLPANGGGKE